MEILKLEVGTRLVEYHEAWDTQRRIHAEVVAGERPDTLILVEHQSVYTAGRRTASWDRPDDDTPVVDVDRGGKITWHGPGQLVGYPIVRLREPVDVVRYVRALEQATMDLCASYGLSTIRVDGRSGVWLPATQSQSERKVCAIGVRVAKGVTMHGFALNCDPDLGQFTRIVPCGISDAGVTSLTAELGRDVSVTETVPAAIECLRNALADVRLTTSATTMTSTGAAADATPTKETV
ncbi:lipoyl(octanoyl) transferase LipB [Demequina aurantiaca]|uniref:lipoyl(octanoyl) transferase LipB n=1 Tax=Demequina aurantiaca TaxID=676200 RepID=UPI003D34BF53